MKVMKFGGSSIANARKINKVISIIFKSLKDKDYTIVVVSALGGVTDKLVLLTSLAVEGKNKYQTLFKNICKKHNLVIKELIKKAGRKKVLKEADKKYKELEKVLKNIYFTKKLSLRSLDRVMSFGEQLSAYIISEAIRSKGVKCHFVDIRTLIKTDDNFGQAEVDVKSSNKLLLNYFKNHHQLSVIGGFIASTKKGITTTLGRGGSDYTASLVGAALDVSRIEIWSDVDGIMTADPRKVKNAVSIPEISYEEAEELAHLGAKVIHPKTIKPAQLKGIPIYIKNTFNPGALGTKISNKKVKIKNFYESIK